MPVQLQVDEPRPRRDRDDSEWRVGDFFLRTPRGEAREVELGGIDATGVVIDDVAGVSIESGQIMCENDVPTQEQGTFSTSHEVVRAVALVPEVAAVPTSTMSRV